MYVQDILRKLDLGSSVAEFDREAERHFVITNSFRALIENKADIIAGEKGAGKTAIYRHLSRQYKQIADLSKVEIVTAFNPSGSPVFQRLANTQPLSEGQYLTIWKAYILSLVGNWLLKILDGDYPEHCRKLDTLLSQTGLRSSDDTASSIFSRLAGWAHRLLNPKSAGMKITFDQFGIPIIKPQLEFSEPNSETVKTDEDFVAHDEALATLNSALDETDVTVWIVLDRLDEAFVGYPDVEIPALRALLRTYLDLLAFDRLAMKLFVRKDLYKRIIKGGFVNLTHLNARRNEIIWDKEDLFTLLCRRLRENQEFVEAISAAAFDDQLLFNAVFPEQVEAGERRPTTWNWMLAQIKDGAGFVSPRNLIDLANLAKDEQLRQEQRNQRAFSHAEPLIEAESLKRALVRLSEQRVEDTLLAEASNEVAMLIEGFRGSRGEHNDESIAALFRVDASTARHFAETLIDIGLLERAEESYKIPVLYRDGLKISRGKAF